MDYSPWGHKELDVTEATYQAGTQYSSKFGKLSSGHRTGKGVFIPIPKKSNAKECSKYHTSAHNPHASKTVLKILQARLQQYMNRELPDVRAGFTKEEKNDQIGNIQWIIEKAREFQKNIYFCFIDYAKAFDCVDHNKLENSERDGNTGTPGLPPEKSVCRSRSNI